MKDEEGDMEKKMQDALTKYGQLIKRGGWDAGEPFIAKMEKKFPHFRKWGYALGIVLRATYLIDEKRQRKA